MQFTREVGGLRCYVIHHTLLPCEAIDSSLCIKCIVAITLTAPTKIKVEEVTIGVISVKYDSMASLAFVHTCIYHRLPILQVLIYRILP